MQEIKFCFYFDATDIDDTEIKLNLKLYVFTFKWWSTVQVNLHCMGSFTRSCV
jgi:hypothetical protein